MSKVEYLKYEVEFWDHSRGMKEPVRCRVVGYCLGEDKTHFKFSFWLVDTQDQDLFNTNLEPFCILKSTIIKKKRLR